MFWLFFLWAGLGILLFPGGLSDVLYPNMVGKEQKLSHKQRFLVVLLSGPSIWACELVVLTIRIVYFIFSKIFLLLK